MKKNFWLWIVPGAISVLILNLVAHFLYMVFYSYVVNPGQEFISYQQHALASAPYVSFIVGFPAMLLVCWWIAKRTPAKWALTGALLTGLAYLLIDLSIVVYLGEYSSILLLFAISYIPYLIAAYVGAKMATPRPSIGQAAP